MSQHDPDHDHEQHDEAHAEEHHEEPPPPDEPKTPTWLTALGVGMFLLAGVWFLATRPAGKTVDQLRPAPAAASASAAAAAVSAVPRPMAPPGGSQALPVPVRPNLQMLRPTPIRPAQ